MDYTYEGIVVSAIIIGLIEVMKRLGMPDKFSPVPSILLGLAAGMIFIKPDDWKAGVIIGLNIGLAACGAFSIGKTAVEAIKGK